MTLQACALFNRCCCSEQCGQHIWPHGHSQESFGQQTEASGAWRGTVSLYPGGYVELSSFSNVLVLECFWGLTCHWVILILGMVVTENTNQPSLFTFLYCSFVGFVHFPFFVIILNYDWRDGRLSCNVSALYT